MKRILLVSGCYMRGNTIGLIGNLLDELNKPDIDFFISLFDIGFFDKKHDPQKYSVDSYYCLPVYSIERLARKIPKLRTLYAQLITITAFKRNEVERIMKEAIS